MTLSWLSWPLRKMHDIFMTFMTSRHPDSGTHGTVHATQYKQHTSDVLVAWWCCGDISWSSWHGSEVSATFYLLRIRCLCEHRTVVLCAEQRAFIIEWYFHTFSFKRVADWFELNFLESPMPSKSNNKRVVDHFCTSWSLQQKEWFYTSDVGKMCPKTFWNEPSYVKMKGGAISKIYCKVYKQFHKILFVIVVRVSVLHRGFQNKWNTLYVQTLTSEDFQRCFNDWKPKLKLTLKWQHLGDLDGIKQTQAEDLRTLTSEDFRKCFSDWKIRLHKCIQASPLWIWVKGTRACAREPGF